MSEKTLSAAFDPVNRIDTVIAPGKLDEPLLFHKIHQGKATNTLPKLKTQIIDQEQINYNGEAMISSEGYKLFIENFKELSNGLNISAKMLLDILVITATEGKGEEALVKLPLKDYMEMRGLRDIKAARNQVKKDIEILSNLRISYREKRRGNEGDWLDVNLFGGTKGLTRGIISFRFNPDFFKILMSYPVMNIPAEALKFDTRHHPSSYYLLRVISEHKNMNYHKANADIIGVKTLLNASPSLPKYEAIKDIGGIDQRIIAPFERDMDAIDSFNWYYCGKNGLQIDEPASYQEFEEANIKIEWLDYPVREKKKRSPVKKKIPQIEE